MSIALNIERISSAKQDIVNEIKEKGINIPDSVKIEDIPSYIASIQQGSNLSFTDDGNGNVTLHGLRMVDDGSGNIVIGG